MDDIEISSPLKETERLLDVDTLLLRLGQFALAEFNELDSIACVINNKNEGQTVAQILNRAIAFKTADTRRLRELNEDRGNLESAHKKQLMNEKRLRHEICVLNEKLSASASKESNFLCDHKAKQDKLNSVIVELERQLAESRKRERKTSQELCERDELVKHLQKLLSTKEQKLTVSNNQSCVSELLSSGDCLSETVMLESIDFDVRLPEPEDDCGLSPSEILRELTLGG